MIIGVRKGRWSAVFATSVVLLLATFQVASSFQTMHSHRSAVSFPFDLLYSTETHWLSSNTLASSRAKKPGRRLISCQASRRTRSSSWTKSSRWNFRRQRPELSRCAGTMVHEPVQDVSTLKDESEKDPRDTSPKTLREAFRVFFFAQYNGPRLVVVALAGLSVWRYSLPTGVDGTDCLVIAATVVFWWLQEHVMHGKLLHSNFDWIGKDIHSTHHEKDYFHISIDPAGLMLAWMCCAHLALLRFLPLPWALSATIGYAGAGLFYEWAHFIVHTKVRFRKGSYWQQMKDHHIRHHLVDHNYWLGFSVPAVDDLFGTNPTVQEARRRT